MLADWLRDTSGMFDGHVWSVQSQASNGTATITVRRGEQEVGKWTCEVTDYGQWPEEIARIWAASQKQMAGAVEK
jgi:hypothetical protein